MIPEVINIVSANLAGDYKISIAFDDGKHHVVDFGPFLTKSVHPSIRAYLNPQKFAEFYIQHGELLWGDYELCFPVLDLYLNKLDKYPTVAEAA
jgi:hypothetical protein